MSQNSYNQFEQNDCCICLETISKIDEKILNCLHVIHNQCYESFMKSPAKKSCPLCRKNILDRNQICNICNNEIVFDESFCNVFQSMDCGCFFHYDCIKSKGTLNCVTCNKDINSENIKALSYLYFENGYRKWIGPILRCHHEECQNTGNPKRFGYCSIHNQYQTTNIAVKLSFIYFTRFVNGPIERGQYIFEEIVKYMDANFKYGREEEIDFAYVKSILNSIHN